MSNNSKKEREQNLQKIYLKIQDVTYKGYAAYYNYHNYTFSARSIARKIRGKSISQTTLIKYIEISIKKLQSKGLVIHSRTDYSGRDWYELDPETFPKGG